MTIKNKISLITTIFVFLSFFIVTFFYYPKWHPKHNEKVITWDVAGYYQYLPAFLIHHDLKKLSYLEGAFEKYRFSAAVDQARVVENGNRVLKYSSGQAIMFSPFFIAAHLYAKNSLYNADGFSTPYQLAIEFEILFFSFFGLWFLRKILLIYFSDKVTALTILGIGLGSNYLEYATMNGAMTHNNLFALYSILIYSTIQFKKSKKTYWAIICGLIIGLCTITRPTEIVSCLIPILWPFDDENSFSIADKLKFIKLNLSQYLFMGLAVFTIGIIQPIYWKYVSGNWFVYSYGKEGFDWLSPHIYDCLLSARAGWLVYSPIMVFSLIGFYFLYRRNKSIFLPVFSICLLVMYIAFSWETWWYGGSVGQRALVQYYPLFAMPFAAFIAQVRKSNVWKWIILALSALFVYHNLWITHQAHRGGLLDAGNMTTSYFTHILWKYNVSRDARKRLDHREHFNGNPSVYDILYQNDFEDEPIPPKCHLAPIEGKHSYCLSKIDPSTGELPIPNVDPKSSWLRVSGDFFAEYRVWSKWNMGLLAIRFYKDEWVIKFGQIRLHRMLIEPTRTSIYMDIKIPEEPFDRVSFEITHGNGHNIVLVDNLRVIQWK